MGGRFLKRTGATAFCLGSFFTASLGTPAFGDMDRDKVIGLARDGLSVREIAEETKLSRSKVGRIRKLAAAAGELKKEPTTGPA